MEHCYDVAVVGGGIAGYSAALSAKHLLLDVLWLGEKGFGAVRAAEHVSNYPAFAGTGEQFSAALSLQAEREGVTLTPARVDGVYASSDGFVLTAGRESYAAKSVILATGVERSGGLRGEGEFLGRGVSYCAVCDGALYRGKQVVAVLGSSRYEEEAEFLARFAKKLTCFCLYRDPKLRGENVEVRPERPAAVEGGARVERVVFAGGSVPADGVFFLRDSTPPAALCGGLQTDGVHVAVKRDMSTNLKGLFAAGDVTGRPYQYVKAAGEGCVAAHSAKSYLLSLKK